MYSHDVWQVENGLPQDAVQAITQTKDGYLWLGTEQGLVRFDGARFTVFNRKNTPALKNSYTRALYADPDGTLWIGMASGGLIRLRDGKFESAMAGVEGPRSMINAIVRDGRGNLWIGTGAGLSQLHGDKLVDYQEGGRSFNDSVTALMVDRSWRPVGGHGREWAVCYWRKGGQLHGSARLVQQPNSGGVSGS